MKGPNCFPWFTGWRSLPVILLLSLLAACSLQPNAVSAPFPSSAAVEQRVILKIRFTFQPRFRIVPLYYHLYRP